MVEVHGDDALPWLSPGGTVPVAAWEAKFVDETFPAVATSIHGRKDEGWGDPQCFCGLDAHQSEPRRPGNSGSAAPARGRFWHCGRQRCNFFRWVSHLEKLSGKVWWQRFEDFVLVKDRGFLADDLLQGAVGDCWFLSALAVVAQRPDLILRLFKGQTETRVDGRYTVQLFLDGRWDELVVDDQLPCVAQQTRSDGSQLAFSRAKDKQLWVPLLEKAYAKAHGSYRAISGGSVAEALLDLTGAATETIHLEEVQPMDLWERLVTYHSAQLPMGCGTAAHPDLEEVGLVGYHAYSILDLREVDAEELPAHLRDRSNDLPTVQLVRLRNPHGMGEWNRDWSDMSSHWTDSLEQTLGRSGVNDGTFWMDFIHFVMAFEVVDVCFAFGHWHASSFQNCFCAKMEESRLCRDAYILEVDGHSEVYCSVLQPTKRGTWVRGERKRFYQPGDVSLLLMHLEDASDVRKLNMERLVASQLRGNQVRSTLQASLDAGTYLLLPYCLGTGPVAITGGPEAAPWTLRLQSSQPLRCSAKALSFTAQLGRCAVEAPRSLARQDVPRSLLDDRLQDEVRFTASGAVAPEGSMLLWLEVGKSRNKALKLQIVAKAVVLRDQTGLCTAKQLPREMESLLPCELCGRTGHSSRTCSLPQTRKQRRWRQQLAPWKLYEIYVSLQHNTQRLCAVLVSTSDQAALGFLRSAAETHAATTRSGTQTQSMFDAWPLEAVPKAPFAMDDQDEEAQLQAALLASLQDGPSDSPVAEQERPKEKKPEKNKKDTAAKPICSDEEVAVSIVALARTRTSQYVTMNELNQDAAFKKILKPLLKKHQVKLSKVWLSKFPHLLKVSEEGSSVVVRLAD